MRLYKAELKWQRLADVTDENSKVRGWEKWTAGLNAARAALEMVKSEAEEAGETILVGKVFRVELKTSPLKHTIINLLNKDGLVGDVYTVWSMEKESEKMAIGKA